MRQLVRVIDNLSRACGALAAVLVISLIVLMLYDVMMRYVFNSPTLWGFEVNTYLMGAAFILSVGYALSHDAHVRVDLLYTAETRWRLKWVDLIGFTVLMLPATIWITAGLWNYFSEAYRTGERSGGSAWNPVLWPFRFVLFAGFVMLTLQVVGEIIRRVYMIKGDPIGTASEGGHSSV